LLFNFLTIVGIYINFKQVTFLASRDRNYMEKGFTSKVKRGDRDIK
jgi:hypothetical protein